MCIFNQFPGATDAALLGTRFGNPGPEDQMRRRVRGQHWLAVQGKLKK